VSNLLNVVGDLVDSLTSIERFLPKYAELRVYLKAQSDTDSPISSRYSQSPASQKEPEYKTDQPSTVANHVYTEIDGCPEKIRAERERSGRAGIFAGEPPVLQGKSATSALTAEVQLSRRCDELEDDKHENDGVYNEEHYEGNFRERLGKQSEGRVQYDQNGFPRSDVADETDSSSNREIDDEDVYHEESKVQLSPADGREYDTSTSFNTNVKAVSVPLIPISSNSDVTANSHSKASDVNDTQGFDATVVDIHMEREPENIGLSATASVIASMIRDERDQLERRTPQHDSQSNLFTLSNGMHAETAPNEIHSKSTSSPFAPSLTLERVHALSADAAALGVEAKENQQTIANHAIAIHPHSTAADATADPALNGGIRLLSEEATTAIRYRPGEVVEVKPRLWPGTDTKIYRQ
jgi:hypothetical protein